VGFLFVFGAEKFGSLGFFVILNNNMPSVPQAVLRGDTAWTRVKKNENKFA
jgi:hypothetical protein